MSDLLSFCPAPPSWAVPWDDLRAAYPWVRDLHDCPQDPTHHPEGDVGTHTRMVVAALVGLPAWRALPAGERAVLFAAAVLHDVAKPACTRHEGGRITSPGHSRRGAVMARTILWREAVPFAAREQVAALVRHHQVPYFLINRPDARRLAIEVSQTARCDLLALLAEADVRGRLSVDRPRLLDNVALTAEFCREQGCLTAPYPFPSDHARFLYFRSPGRQPPDSPAHEDFPAEVTLLSGLPGAGKDTWLRTHAPDLPVVSLDALRAALDVDPADEQGRVVQEARAAARDLLRRGASFAWNATNLSRQLRDQVIRLLADYRARVRIVYLEVPAERLSQQNRQRPAPVPQAVLERLLGRWEVPDRTEAHEVLSVVRDAG